MAYRQAKVYFDGSHFIAIPQENFKHKKQKKTVVKANTDLKVKFEQAYKDSQLLPRKQIQESITNTLSKEIADKEQLVEFVENNIQRKKANSIAPRVRLMRKLRLQEWNYFCTVTQFYGH